MSGHLNTLLDSPIGRIAYQPFKQLVHFYRKRANPNVPLDHDVIRVRCRDRQFAIEVRRWSQSDRMAVDQCFVDQQYDMPGGTHGKYLDKLFREILAEGRKPLIVDCGANIGASVLWLSARYPEAHIVAIEPAPDNFELLQKNCRGVDADLIQAGIGKEDGVAWLSDPRGGGMGYRTTDENTGVQIPLVSLKTVMDRMPASTYAPFLLKVDIEGGEKALFGSDTELLNQFPVIIMEPHDWMFPGGGTSVEFFRFHARTSREFAMKAENVASVIIPHSDPGIPDHATS